MDNVQLLADLIYEYPTEVVTRSGCEGLAKHLIEHGVTFSAAVPGHDDQYNIAEMSFKNGYEKGLEESKREHTKYGRWIIKSRGHGNKAMQWAECSECLVCGSPQWKVCPVCETKMNPVQFPVNNFDPDDLMGEYEDENA